MEDLHCWQSKFKNCYYAERLISKIKLLNKRSNYKVDLIQIKKAIYYAKKYHYGQKRNSGEPYYTHPLCVAEMVADHVFKTDILVTSILHDVIEDTKLNKNMLDTIFNNNIASQVDDLTRIKLTGKINSTDLINSLYYQGKLDLLVVKIFDRLHNMQTLGAKPAEKRKHISEETLVKFLSLNIYLGATVPRMLNVEEKLKNLIYQHLNISQSFLQEFQMNYCDYFSIQPVVLDFENDGSRNSTIC